MKNRKGFILPTVVLVFVFLMIIIPVMVKWVQEDTRISTKDQRSSLAFNLAEAAVDRGYWKVKSSTGTFYGVMAGAALAGYNFDAVYSDISGGTYRVSVSSGPGAYQITVLGEGRDLNRGETRALKVVYQNASVPGAVIAGGMFSAFGASTVHWGPVMAMNDITVTGAALNVHHPRKLSKQVVRPYDSSLSPPNTDGLEWWSDYDVPELPQFDFATMRASAAATGTLNCNGMPKNTNGYITPCNSTCVSCNVSQIYNDVRYNKGYTWYWDNSVGINGTGIRGTFIVRGDYSINGSAGYVPGILSVPSDAWQEYQKLDTAASNEYPADTGLKSNAATYALGTSLANYGFVYVGGDYDEHGGSDIFGALWVVGNFTGHGNTVIYYDSSLRLPTLNVVLTRLSWEETSPSVQAWP
jgi:hypothetical protein